MQLQPLEFIDILRGQIYVGKIRPVQKWKLRKANKQPPPPKKLQTRYQSARTA